jgi:hypothetical protein
MPTSLISIDKKIKRKTDAYTFKHLHKWTAATIFTAGRVSLAHREADSNSSPRSVIDVVCRSELIQLTGNHQRVSCGLVEDHTVVNNAGGQQQSPRQGSGARPPYTVP